MCENAGGRDPRPWHELRGRLAGPGGAEHVFEGKVFGRLQSEPKGGAGFGYDPLFVPEGHDVSFAELGDAVKAKLSHRARAWMQLADWARRGAF